MRKPEEKPMNEIKNNNDSNKIKIQDNRRMFRIVLPLILALISMLVLTRISTSRDFHAKTIASLDDKKSTVMELTAASTAASAALTLLPGDTATLSVKVMATGPVKTYDRIFLVEVNPDSTDLTENVDYLPLTREGVIKAGESAAEVEVRLIRTDILQEKEQRLGLRLVANEYFSLAFPEWAALIGSHRTGPVYEHFDASLHTLRIADFMVEPKVWVGTAVSPYNGGYESGNWGAFSRKKLELICERFNLTYNDFMSNETMPSALQMLIYKSMSTYLIQCYNDKKPVLEEDGRLMWFSGCPWLSKVGVPWVPEEGYYD